MTSRLERLICGVRHAPTLSEDETVDDYTVHVSLQFRINVCRGEGN